MTISYTCVKCERKLKPTEICSICFPHNSTTQTAKLTNDQIEIVRHLYRMTISKMVNQSHIYVSDDIRKLKNDLKRHFPNEAHHIMRD